MTFLFIGGPLVLFLGTTLGWYLYKNSGSDDAFAFMVPFLISLVACCGCIGGGFGIKNARFHEQQYVDKMTTTYKIHVVDYSKDYNWIKFQKNGRDCRANLDPTDSKLILVRTVDCEYASLSLDDAVKGQQ